MTNTIIDIAMISSLVLGITAVISQTGYLPSRFKPLFALVLGIALALVFSGLTRDNALVGIIASLSSMGLWSGTKKTLEKPEEPLG